jgi:hypothetical protein
MQLVIRQKGDKSPLTVTRAGDLALFIKYMAMINAAGEFGEAAFIVAIDDMPAEKFEVVEVGLLCPEPGVGSRGKLYFCSTRAGNAALWKHWLLNSIIPTLRKCRQAHNKMVS